LGVVEQERLCRSRMGLAKGPPTDIFPASCATTSTGRRESSSKREKEIFPRLADGIAIKEVAEKLCISSKTVEFHKYNVMEKTRYQFPGRTRPDRHQEQAD
jgi:DNA-binding NarL/FixJ family response regulator